MIWLREWRQTKGVFIRFLLIVLFLDILAVIIMPREAQFFIRGQLQILFGIICAVLLASGSFFKEIQQETFQLLLSKPLRKYKILLGKITIALLECYILIIFSKLIALSVQMLKFSDITFIEGMKYLPALLSVPLVYFCISLFFTVLTESRNKSVVLAYIIGTIFILSAPKIYHPGGLSLEPKVMLFYLVIPAMLMTTAFLIFEEKETK